MKQTILKNKILYSQKKKLKAQTKVKNLKKKKIMKF
jgi:hypothetical protein